MMVKDLKFQHFYLVKLWTRKSRAAEENSKQYKHFEFYRSGFPHQKNQKFLLLFFTLFFYTVKRWWQIIAYRSTTVNFYFSEMKQSLNPMKRNRIQFQRKKMVPRLKMGERIKRRLLWIMENETLINSHHHMQIMSTIHTN